MLQIYYKAFELVKKLFDRKIGQEFFFFFWISNKSFIEDKILYVCNDEHKVS